MKDFNGERKKEIKKRFDEGRRVVAASSRLEYRIPSNLKNNKDRNGKLKCASWTRYYSTQYFGQKPKPHEDIVLKFNTDISMEKHFFYYLLDSMGVPADITIFDQNLASKNERVNLYGRFDDVFVGYTKGKHQKKYEDEKGSKGNGTNLTKTSFLTIS